MITPSDLIAILLHYQLTYSDIQKIDQNKMVIWLKRKGSIDYKFDPDGRIQTTYIAPISLSKLK